MDLVQRVALKVRQNAEELAARRRASKRLRFMCALCSTAIFQSLAWRGVKAAVVSGYFVTRKYKWEHTWVEVAGMIVDVTYTQFNPEGARVLVADISDARYEPVTRWDDIPYLYRRAIPRAWDRDLIQIVVTKLQAV